MSHFGPCYEGFIDIGGLKSAMARDKLTELRRRVYLVLEQGPVGIRCGRRCRPAAGRAHPGQPGRGRGRVGRRNIGARYAPRLQSRSRFSRSSCSRSNTACGCGSPSSTGRTGTSPPCSSTAEIRGQPRRHRSISSRCCRSASRPRAARRRGPACWCSASCASSRSRAIRPRCARCSTCSTASAARCSAAW